MARPLRIEFPDALYHVTSRGNERRPIFNDDVDRQMFLIFLSRTVKRFGWSLTAWVLMSNHFHLVIQTPEANLSRGMHWLNSAYAGWFNRRYQRSGHLFEGRFHAFLVEKETYLRELLRYVVLNPVRAKIVARPENYRWSSYRSTAGLEAADHWLDVASILSLFDDDPSVARCEYQEFVLTKVEGTERLWSTASTSVRSRGRSAYEGSWNQSHARLIIRKRTVLSVGRKWRRSFVPLLRRLCKLQRVFVRCAEVHCAGWWRGSDGTKGW